MDPRRRVHAAVAVLTTLLLTACANERDAYPHGEQGASSTDGSLLRTLALYVGAPLLVAGIIAALAWLPGMVRGTRYRPQYGWSAEPVWFAGPTDPEPALAQASTGDVVRGGSGGSW